MVQFIVTVHFSQWIIFEEKNLYKLLLEPVNLLNCCENVKLFRNLSYCREN